MDADSASRARAADLTVGVFRDLSELNPTMSMSRDSILGCFVC